MAEERFRNEIGSISDLLCGVKNLQDVEDFLHNLVRAVDGNFEAIKNNIDPLSRPDLDFDNRGFPPKLGDVDHPQPDEGGDPGGGGGVDPGGGGGDPAGNGGGGGGPFTEGYIFAAKTVSEISGASGGQPGSGLVCLLEMERPGGPADSDLMEEFDEAMADGDYDAAFEILREIEDPVNGVDQLTLTLPSDKNPAGGGDQEMDVDGADDFSHMGGDEDGGGSEEQGDETDIPGVAYNIAEGKIKKGKKVIVGKDANNLWWVLVEDCQEPEEGGGG